MNTSSLVKKKIVPENVNLGLAQIVRPNSLTHHFKIQKHSIV